MKKDAKGSYLVTQLGRIEIKIGKSHCAQIRALILSASLICTPRLLTQD